MSRNTSTFKKAFTLLAPLIPLALLLGVAWHTVATQREEMEGLQNSAYSQRLVSEITEASLRARLLADNSAGYAVALDHAGYALGALEELPHADEGRMAMSAVNLAIQSADKAGTAGERLAALAALERSATALDAIMANAIESQGERARQTLSVAQWLAALFLALLLAVLIHDRVALLRSTSLRLRVQMPQGPAVLQLVSGAASSGYRFTSRRR